MLSRLAKCAGLWLIFFFQAEDGIRDIGVTGVQTCALPISACPRRRRILGAFLFSGDDVDKPAGVLSGGEKTRLALSVLVCSGANVLLLDEPTNNLDPVSREQVLDAIARYPGAIVLVTHDAGAVQALKPDRAILLPDGVEDAWSDDLLELVELA